MRARLRKFRLTLAALTAGLCACADLQWTRPGADDAALRADLEQCRWQAHQVGTALQLPSLTDREIPRSLQIRGGEAGAPPGAASDHRLAEFQELQSCMSRKGYRLTQAAAQRNQE